ncbi:MAG: DUF799 family lipoprotein [Kiritimatiellae bacterium]|nr:DUF799 family lipoprotein [Kiritimatiellia bacterium]
MKNLHMLTAGLTVLLIAGCASPKDKYFLDTKTKANIYMMPKHHKIHKVAIMPFKAPTELIGNSVSDMLVTEMLRMERYELVERGQMAQVLNESELSLAGLSAAKAVEIGNMLGADGVIIGTVDEYGTTAIGGRAYPVVGVSARLIDCETGKVVWSVDLAERAEKKDVALSAHARSVVHNMVAALYAEWRKRQ